MITKMSQEESSLSFCEYGARSLAILRVPRHSA